VTPCQHRELKWNLSAQTSVMAVQTTVWGVECVGCGKKWDVGQVMQAVVDLATSQERVRELEAGSQKMERLLIAAGAILGHGTPGSAWVDWRMRVQGVLGLAFTEGRWANGEPIPFDQIRRMVEDMPTVHVNAVRAALRGPSTVGHPEAKPVGEGGVHGLGKGMGDDRDPSSLQRGAPDG